MRILPFLFAALVAGCSQPPDAPATPPRDRTEGTVPAEQTTTSRSTETESDPSGPATVSNVRITRPVEGAVARENPIRVEGTARTFENNVVLELLDAEGNRILQTSTTARGELGHFNPWAEDLWLTAWPGEHLTVRAVEFSARDGSVRSEVRVRLENGFDRIEATLYFPNAQRSPNDCSQTYPVQHELPKSVAMGRLLTEALIAGPTEAEIDRGFSSPFPRGARVDSIDIDGRTLTIDFSSDLQNVGGSCRAQAIRASVERTLETLPNIDRVVIRAGGSEELALQP